MCKSSIYIYKFSFGQPARTKTYDPHFGKPCSKYEIEFIEIGTDADHVHFLIQGLPRMSPSEIVRVVKRITGREIFRLHPEVKVMLWGGPVWSSGYYINTVGQYGTEDVIRKYVENQGRKNEYEKVYSNQLRLF